MASLASTLLRIGLWTIIIGLTMYVIHESFEDEPIAEYVAIPLLQKIFTAGAALVAAGVIVGALTKGAKKIAKNRCRVCKREIVPGAMYCRAHLRQILHEEEDRTHLTKVRKT